MNKEIFRIKYIKNEKTLVNFSMDFRKWRRLHRKGGGSPYVIETYPITIAEENRIEITLRREEADIEIEGRKTKEEARKTNE